MKCFLSNSIGRASASQLLLRQLRLIASMLLLVALAGTTAGQDFALRTGHLTDLDLVNALEASVSLDQRARAGLIGLDAPSLTGAIADEQARLAAVMRGFGYLDAHVASAFDATTQTHEFLPSAGPRYMIGAVALSLPDVSDPAWTGDLQAMAQGVIGSPARGDVIWQLVEDLTHRIETSGFPFVRVTNRELTPDSETGLALVRLVLDPGQPATVSAVTLDHARTFTMARLMELVPFSIGERYAPEQVDALRAALAAEPGLQSARVSIVKDVDQEGSLTVAVSVRETVAADLLSDRRTAGQVALLAVLALLALRQVTVAAGETVRSALVQSQTILSMIAMAVAAWFVARRFIDFAGLG